MSDPGRKMRTRRPCSGLFAAEGRCGPDRFDADYRIRINVSIHCYCWVCGMKDYIQQFPHHFPGSKETDTLCDYEAETRQHVL